MVTEILAQITGGNFCAGIYLVDDRVTEGRADCRAHERLDARPCAPILQREGLEKGVNRVLSMSKGKLISVVENCDEVRAAIGSRR